MYRALPPLLTRLRRHRGLWVLAVAVMLIKLVSGTACLADGPEARFASANAPTAASASMNATVEVATNDAGGDCVLGETGGCHCACAHAATLPVMAMLPVTHLDTRLDSSMNTPGYMPAAPGSLIRPPIA